LLEDVYTYNDFIHDGKSPSLDSKKKVTSNVDKPYMVTEYNGHMFPTKAFDDEEHRLEHVLRHTRVLNSLYESEDIVGSFAWCMFDYNTHKEFGSGDRICYHGVMDMFRNHKLASAPYRAFDEKQNVLEISSSMDIGEHPGSFRGDIYAFTNMDSIKAYKNNEFIKEFHRDDSEFKNLSYGPILMDDFIGNQLEKHEGFKAKKSEEVKKILGAISKHGLNHLPLGIKLSAAKLFMTKQITFEEGYQLFGKYIGNWGEKVTTYRFEGIKEGKIVKVVTKEPMKEIKLQVDVDRTILKEESTYDVASIRILAVDNNENLLNYYQEAVLLEVEGDLQIIGPKIITLKGGMGGTYVKTTGKAGTGGLIISGEGLKPVKLNFEIIKD
ncbi:MAG: glycoside hydrolase family 2 protein, partial [Clostridium sp.]